MALVLQLMAAEDQTVGELAGRIGGYAMLKDKFPAAPEQADRIIARAEAHFKDAQVNTDDGCRLDLDDGWIHLRVSNTEPVMRMIIEAQSQASAQRYADIVLKMRDEVLG